MAGLLLDLTPLRASPAFRRLWWGQAVSNVGSGLTTFALALQTFRITGSSAAVGLLVAAGALPLVLLGVLGGVIADRMERRRLDLTAGVVRLVVATGLAAQAFAGSDHLWPLFVLEVLAGMGSAAQSPARRATMANLLEPDQRAAGAALSQLVFHFGSAAGAALGGVITAGAGLRWCYLADAVSFLVALYGVVRLPRQPLPDLADRHPLHDLREGFRFIRGDRVLTGLLLADLDAMVLGMPVSLFPAIVAERFGGSATVLGWLTAAPTVGGVLGSLLSGKAVRSTRPGRGQLLAVGVWGVSLAIFGFSSWLALSLPCLIVAGAVDNLGVVQRAGLLRNRTPDRLMGRVGSVEYSIGAGAPGLGNLEAGVVASISTTTISAVSGGIGAAIGALLIGVLIPELPRVRPDGR